MLTWCVSTVLSALEIKHLNVASAGADGLYEVCKSAGVGGPSSKGGLVSSGARVGASISTRMP